MATLVQGANLKITTWRLEMQKNVVIAETAQATETHSFLLARCDIVHCRRNSEVLGISQESSFVLLEEMD
jgi:hypothetical protein